MWLLSVMVCSGFLKCNLWIGISVCMFVLKEVIFNLSVRRRARAKVRRLNCERGWIKLRLNLV